MSAGFVFHPHVRRSDGATVTPDILIDRVRVVGPDSVTTRPVTHLTAAVALQRPADGIICKPAYVLVAASFGMLVAVGAIFDDALPVGRDAWRCDDARSRFRGPFARFYDGSAQTVIDQLSRVPTPPEVMERLGDGTAPAPGTAVFVHGAAPAVITAHRMEISLERASGECLFHGFDIVGTGPPA